MNTIGFAISHKKNDKRRACLPEDIKNGILHADHLYFEKGYGSVLGISDGEYEVLGCHIVSREEVLKCDIIVDVKLGNADYIESIENGKVLFGWAHAVQNTDFTSKVIAKNHTVIAWEEIYEDNRHIFYRNNEIAGEAAVLHAFQYCGKMPYETKAAILGNGQSAKGAMRFLHGLGAEVDVYGRKTEALFRKKMFDYDVLINCIMWDTSRTDRIIYKDDLKKMKKGALIIDISCDPHLEIETSHPTTIDDPVYEVDGVLHYAVDNIPAMFPITSSKVLSESFSKYLDSIVENKMPDPLQKAMIIENGHILDTKIIDFRNKRGLICK